MGARYLIRFDDICPTMNWSIWESVEELLRGARIKPILAIIPDNRDPRLKFSEPDFRFWDRVRTWQNQGWTIGWHGYQHLPMTRDGGILKHNRWSEFSGLSAEEQRSKLQSAWRIFVMENVHPELWIAPAHSFDAITLALLREFGIRRLSDGFSLYPYRDSHGMMWVPQQLWKFRRMPFGIWTICFHLNGWTVHDVNRLRSDLQEFEPALTDWNSIVAWYESRKRGVFDLLFSETYPRAFKIWRLLKK